MSNSRRFPSQAACKTQECQRRGLTTTVCRLMPDVGHFTQTTQIAHAPERSANYPA